MDQQQQIMWFNLMNDTSYDNESDYKKVNEYDNKVKLNKKQKTSAMCNNLQNNPSDRNIGEYDSLVKLNEKLMLEQTRKQMWDELVINPTDENLLKYNNVVKLMSKQN